MVWSNHRDEKKVKEAQARFRDKEWMKTLRRAFDLFDLDGGGSIEADELHTMLKGLGITATPEEVKDLVNEVPARCLTQPHTHPARCRWTMTARARWSSRSSVS